MSLWLPLAMLLGGTFLAAQATGTLLIRVVSDDGPIEHAVPMTRTLESWNCRAAG